ncbi:conserved hypothetical protein [Roseibium sp. TrichSKD4]|nr:conserved hypothetical protein [Roseibium sp. TrichSKD4]
MGSAFSLRTAPPALKAKQVPTLRAGKGSAREYSTLAERVRPDDPGAG